MTTENNKIIAEFMEWYYKGMDTYMTPFSDAWSVNGEQTYSCPLNVMRFHSDWNWLMEVVEKIGEKADWSLELLTTDKKEHQMLIPLSNTNIITETKIEAVYNACVEFIKWYNLQNKTT